VEYARRNDKEKEKNKLIFIYIQTRKWQKLIILFSQVQETFTGNIKDIPSIIKLGQGRSFRFENLENPRNSAFTLPGKPSYLTDFHIASGFKKVLKVHLWFTLNGRKV